MGLSGGDKGPGPLRLASFLICEMGLTAVPHTGLEHMGWGEAHTAAQPLAVTFPSGRHHLPPVVLGDEMNL